MFSRQLGQIVLNQGKPSAGCQARKRTQLGKDSLIWQFVSVVFPKQDQVFAGWQARQRFQHADRVSECLHPDISTLQAVEP